MRIGVDADGAIIHLDDRTISDVLLNAWNKRAWPWPQRDDVIRRRQAAPNLVRSLRVRGNWRTCAFNGRANGDEAFLP
jgi:hypothetical protein